MTSTSVYRLIYGARATQSFLKLDWWPKNVIYLGYLLKKIVCVCERKK